MTDMNSMTDKDLQEVTGGLGTTETSETLDYLSRAEKKGLINHSLYLKMLMFYAEAMQHEGSFPTLVQKAKYEGMIDSERAMKLLEFYFRG